MKPRIVPLGDSSALAQMGNEIDLDVNQRVHALAKLIEASAIEGIIETVPSYAALLVHYDPLILWIRCACTATIRVSLKMRDCFAKCCRTDTWICPTC